MTWQPAERYCVLCPSQRMARVFLEVDYQINPMLPILRYFSSPEHLRGYRNTPVYLFDPNAEFRTRELALYRELKKYSGMRNWEEADFAYLKQLSAAS